jgi:putative transposase
MKRHMARIARVVVPGHPHHVTPLSGMIGDWAAFLRQETSAHEAELCRLHERTGKPLGSDEFIAHLEKVIARRPRRKKPGPKKKSAGN